MTATEQGGPPTIVSGPICPLRTEAKHIWSPYGEWIAFSRGTSGPFADVFIGRVNGADRWQVTKTPANEIAGDWGPEPTE